MRSLVFLMMTACTMGPAAAQELPKDLPWDLREQYRLSTERSELAMAGDTGEWQLTLDGVGEVIPAATAGVRLIDGREIWTQDLPAGEPRLERIAGDFGEGIRYVTEGSAGEGLSFRQSLAFHKKRGFYLFEVSVRNTSDAPTRIAAITTARFNVEGFGGNAVVGRRNLALAGPCLVPAASPLLTVFQDPDAGVALAFGALPAGTAQTHCTAEATTGGWEFEAESRFEPPLELAPGESLAADPLWMSVALPTPKDIDLLYAWTHAQRPRPDHWEKAPTAWASAKPGSTERDVYDAAEAWASAGVRHVLVPAGWESAPGSLEGRGGAYPRSLRSVAHTLRQSGFVPGLTIDPLATGDGWFNPYESARQTAAVIRLRDRIGPWGFAFFVIHTAMPDEALEKANLTRVAAERFAFAIAAEAFPETPLWPSAQSVLPAALEPWLEAAAATSRIEEYGGKAGPIALAVERRTEIGRPLAAALRFYGGPIEFRGTPSSSMADLICRALAPAPMAARPLSFEAAPRQWEVVLHSSSQGPRTYKLNFPGAPETPGALQAAGESFLALTPPATGPRRIELARAERSEPEPAAEPEPAPAPRYETRIEKVVVAEATTKEVDTPYEIKAGDTLFKIADAHEVSVDELRAWNGLKGDLIRVGHTLVIKRTEDVPAVIEEREVRVEIEPLPPAPKPEEPKKKGFFGRLFGGGN